MPKSYSAITILRGVLAISIIWHHLQPVPLKIFNIDLFFLISFPGRIIVWLFFVISGYSIFYGYMNGKYDLSLTDTFRFYFNRAIRIFPLFYLTILIGWISFLYLSPQRLPSWQSIIRTLAFLDFNFYAGINTFTPAWFVGIILYFYFFAPVLVKGYIILFHKTGVRITFAVLILFSCACHLFGYWLSGTSDIRNFVGCLPLFLFGFFAYSLNNEGREILEKIFSFISIKRIWLILLLLLECSFFIYAYGRGFFMVMPMECFIGFGGTALIVLILQNQKTSINHKIRFVSFFKKWVKSLFSKLGQHAYGLYLWHWIVIFMFSKAMRFHFQGPPFSSFFERLVFFGMVSTTSYLITIIFYYLLELPFLRQYKKKRLP